MNILINYAKSGESGPAFTYELAKGYKDIGHNVFAVLRDDIPNRDSWNDILGRKNIYWVHRGNNAFTKILSLIRFYTIDLISIKCKFSNKIDVSLKPFYCPNAKIIDKLVTPKKRVAICHDPVLHSGANIDVEKYKSFYNSEDELFVLTPSFVKIASKEFEKTIDLIHYVPHGRMNMYQKNENYAEIAKMYTKKFHLLYFGRIEKYKGLHVLADAYRIVKEKYENVELTILGSGNFDEYREEYKSLRDVHVINRFIRDDEVGNYFSLPNTISVLPYIDATQSGVIPVAYEFGTPVVASDVGGLKEQLDEGKIGLLYTNNNPEMLADCLLKIMSNGLIFEEQKEMMFEYRKTLEWTVIASSMMEALYE